MPRLRLLLQPQQPRPAQAQALQLGRVPPPLRLLATPLPLSLAPPPSAHSLPAFWGYSWALALCSNRFRVISSDVSPLVLCQGLVGTLLCGHYSTDNEIIISIHTHRLYTRIVITQFLEGAL